MKRKQRILVLGAGFAGLEFCKKITGDNAEVILVDRQNHHLFQPLLYQVAMAGLSAAEIAQPIRNILRSKQNVTVLLDEVEAIDLQARKVTLSEQETPLSYDYLVIAMGVRTTYFGNDHWAARAPGLKSIDDARRIRNEVLVAFEKAENTSDPDKQRRLMTFVVIGAGPTGVEIAGALAELSRFVLVKDFRIIAPEKARVILLEGGPRVLPAFDPSLSEKALHQLQDMGVEVHLNAMVKNIDEQGVTLENECIEAENVIWTAGVGASPITRTLGVETDRGGRILVNPDLSLPGHPEVFALGDIASLTDVNGVRVPGVSPAAIQMANHAAKIVSAEIEKPLQKTERKPFAYWDKGSMATIGRSRAVAQIKKLKFGGYPAWVAWLFVHLIFLIGFRNKISVVIQWVYSYFTYKRGARLVTERDRRV